MRERDIEQYLVKRVKAMGGEVRKVKWIGRRGAPDRLVMLPADRGLVVDMSKPITATQVQAMWEAFFRKNVSVWVELKATGKKAEPYQLREHARMRRRGQRVEVIDSFEGVDRVLC